ncbi:MAG: GyrI-like domain-containing protein [Prolixibacteraceae bacterium]|nr:GyrI-like domain-containing protein [Prolixibacteraceae bacterium]MBN2649764.1 GyrI-like domain-containing protein [Prolixibacteraceae bacterium]
MEKKTLQPVNVLTYALSSTLKTIVADSGNIPNELMAKASELGLEVTGPQIWDYYGADGRPDTKFKLKICVPVREVKGDPGKFTFEVLPEITCISEIHKGPWSQLGNTYHRIFGEMSRKKLSPTGANREIYINCDFENEENNVTEVQIVVQ